MDYDIGDGGCLDLGKIEVENIESGPLKWRHISWRYQEGPDCPRSYRVRYWKKYSKKEEYKLTRKTNTTLENLDSNMIYVVEVRAELEAETVDGGKVGDYSQAKEFYTGTVVPKISRPRVRTSFQKQRLNVSWDLEGPFNNGSVFEFFVWLSSPSTGNCISLAHFICKSCFFLNHSAVLDTWDQAQRDELSSCLKKTTVKFTERDNNFHHLFVLDAPLRNFSMEIFAVNMMGVHKVYGPREASKYNDKATTEDERGRFQKVAFFVGLRKNLNKGSSESQRVIFDNVVTNIGNCYNETSGEFEAPTSGVYVFAVTVSLETINEEAVSLMHNGTVVLNVYGHNRSSSVQSVLYVKRFGKVWLKHGAWGSTILGDMRTSFSGYLSFALA